MNKAIGLLAIVASIFGLFAAASSAGAEEYSGLVSYNHANDAGPRTLPLAGGGFNATVYEDKSQACAGGNTDFAGLRRKIAEGPNDWFRFTYKDCKDGFALICIDPDLNGKNAPATCASVATAAPAAPDIMETYNGTVSPSVSDDPDNQSLTFTGEVFGATLTPDPKNVCKGKDNFAVVMKFLKALKEDDRVRISYKNCTTENALVCVDRALEGPFNPKVCGSFVSKSNEGD